MNAGSFARNATGLSQELWNTRGFGCAITWACHCTVLGLDERLFFEGWLEERWAWKYGRPLAQERLKKLWDPAQHLLRQQFWLEMIERYRGFARRQDEAAQAKPPIPAWVKSHLRDIQKPKSYELLVGSDGRSGPNQALCCLPILSSQMVAARAELSVFL